MERGNRFCFSVESASFVEDKIHPVIIRENKAGYEVTKWCWGTDEAAVRQLIEERNNEMGLTPEDVQEIRDNSIRLAIQKDSIRNDIDALSSYITESYAADDWEEAIEHVQGILHAMLDRIESLEED